MMHSWIKLPVVKTTTKHLSEGKEHTYTVKSHGEELEMFKKWKKDVFPKLIDYQKW